MSRAALLLLSVGAALFIALLAWQGMGAVASALAVAGWGLALVAAFHAVPLLLDAAAIAVLFARGGAAAGVPADVAVGGSADAAAGALAGVSPDAAVGVSADTLAGVAAGARSRDDDRSFRLSVGASAGARSHDDRPFRLSVGVSAGARTHDDRPLRLSADALAGAAAGTSMGAAGASSVGAREALLARWSGEAVNSLLPAGQIGGPIVMVRQLAQRGMQMRDAAAAITVSTTLQALAQIVFAVLGIALFGVYASSNATEATGAGSAVDSAQAAHGAQVAHAAHAARAVHAAGVASGASGAPGSLRVAALIATGVLAALIALFYVAQRRGLFGRALRVASRMFGMFGKLGQRDWSALTLRADAIDAAVQALYRARGKAAASFALSLAGWVAGTVEVWLALRFLGHPVDWIDALLLESVGQAIRGAAFAIPGALGVQEGGYLLLAPLVGLPPDAALALSLTKRAREILLGLPGLLYLHVSERSWQRRRAARGVPVPVPAAKTVD